jgi:hypothetical protein
MPWCLKNTSPFFYNLYFPIWAGISTFQHVVEVAEGRGACLSPLLYKSYTRKVADDIANIIQLFKMQLSKTRFFVKIC